MNSDPNQMPGRSIINFFDWEIDKAQNYQIPFHIIEEKVKPDRAKVNRATRRERWWQYAERSIGLYKGINNLRHCYGIGWVSKYLNFSKLPINYVFTNSLYIFTTDRWDLYSVVQSTIHEVWARKYSGALKQDLRYSPSDCFGTFPFPEGLWKTADPQLAAVGEKYHEHRKALMHNLQLGLTGIYNLFHARDLDLDLVMKTGRKNQPEAEKGLNGILELRRLHCELDRAILNAYGWGDLDLGHDFVDVETLPENDRVRYTISPEARKEILKRLLLLNHKIHEQEVKAGMGKEKKIRIPKTKKKDSDTRQTSFLS